MCVELGWKADRLLAVHEGRHAADQLLGVLRVPVTKALDLSTPAGFDSAVATLGARLRRAAGSSDADAIRESIRVLDVDWHATTAEERRRLVSRALIAARRATAMVPERIDAPLGEAADAIISATRSRARREGVAIGAKFNAFDRRVTAHIVSSQGNFVRNEYGHRIDSFGDEARRIVAEGVEQGVGRSEIAADLERAARATMLARSPWYWEVVAGAFVGQGHSWAQISSYAEARIERYAISAVRDQRTTDICRYLDGKTFSVGSALDRFDRVERMSEPEDIKRELPWVRSRIDPESGRTILHARGTGGTIQIAEVIRSAVGTRDDRGEFRALASDSALEKAGIGFPPYHGLCRSVTVALV